MMNFPNHFLDSLLCNDSYYCQWHRRGLGARDAGRDHLTDSPARRLPLLSPAHRASPPGPTSRAAREPTLLEEEQNEEVVGGNDHIYHGAEKQ